MHGQDKVGRTAVEGRHKVSTRWAQGGQNEGTRAAEGRHKDGTRQGTRPMGFGQAEVARESMWPPIEIP